MEASRNIDTRWSAVSPAQLYSLQMVLIKWCGSVMSLSCRIALHTQNCIRFCDIAVVKLWCSRCRYCILTNCAIDSDVLFPISFLQRLCCWQIPASWCVTVSCWLSQPTQVWLGDGICCLDCQQSEVQPPAQAVQSLQPVSKTARCCWASHWWVGGHSMGSVSFYLRTADCWGEEQQDCLQAFWVYQLYTLRSSDRYCKCVCIHSTASMLLEEICCIGCGCVVEAQ